jgi:hypothetical protein
MRTLLKNTLSLLFVLNALICYAQEPQSITGKLIDNQSGEVIPFATVKLRTHMMGVISNANGGFKIPLKYRELDDFIIISCIGYTSKTIALKSLNEGEVNIIRLVPFATMLEGVTISSRKNRRGKYDSAGYRAPKAYSPERVVGLAIKSIPKNYPQGPYSYVGYYRDYQYRHESYLNLNEAIVEVFDKGFKTNDQVATQLSLFEYRQNLDFSRDSAAAVPYDNKPVNVSHSRNKYIPNAILSPQGGNELSILRLHDAVRNNDIFAYSFVNIFSKDFLPNHFLKMEEEVYLDTLKLYCISFESRYAASGPRNFAKGKLFIEKKNFAIHKIEYATFNKTMRDTQLMYDIRVEYVRNGDQMFLNYISFNNGFRLNNDALFKMIEFAYDPRERAFVVDFNTIPQRESVMDTANYNFTVRNTKLKISRVEITGERRILICLDNEAAEALERDGNWQNSGLKMDVDNIRDVHNRPLDIDDDNTIFQFRELFVQKIGPGGSATGGTILVRKDLPLEYSQANRPNANVEFWMNSPLKAKE